VRLVLAALLLAPGACSTKRFLRIDSDPPGARVWVNGEEKGEAPVTVPFVHYGRTHVRLEKPGYESLATDVRVDALIDGYPVVDLPFELAVRERRFEWTGRLTRRPPASPAEIEDTLRRAREFRERTRSPAPVR
jgi:hypothetical protein